MSVPKRDVHAHLGQVNYISCKCGVRDQAPVHEGVERTTRIVDDQRASRCVGASCSRAKDTEE